MALDRAWFNGLVDDAGDGLTGTVWNKSQVGSLITDVDKTQVCCQVASNGLPLTPNVQTLITWDVEDYDPVNMHAPAQNSAVSMPHAGVYFLSVNVLWQAYPTGYRGLAFRANGSILISSWHYVQGFDIASVNQSQSLQTMIYLPIGNYVEVLALHNAAGAIWVGGGSRFTVIRVS